MVLTLIKAHLLGVAIAVVFQGLLQVIGNFKMRPLTRYFNHMKDVAKTHQLEISPYFVRSTPLQSEVALVQPNPLSMAEWRIFFETSLHSLLLGWINVLLIGFGLIAVLLLNLPKELLASIDKKVNDIKSGSYNRFDFKSDLIGIYIGSGAIHPNKEYQFRELLSLHEALLAEQDSSSSTQHLDSSCAADTIKEVAKSQVG